MSEGISKNMAGLFTLRFSNITWRTLQVKIAIVLIIGVLSCVIGLQYVTSQKFGGAENVAVMEQLHIVKGSGEYVLADPDGIRNFQKSWSEYGQDYYVDRLLKQKRRGFFVELGAHDGESMSNTLFLEKERDWNGILIEGNPIVYEKLLKKNRKCYSINCCVSNDMNAMEFTLADHLSSANVTMTKSQSKRINYIKKGHADKDFGKVVTIKCQSFNDIMDAIGVNYIDFFSLDVEGAELYILQSIDWRRFYIDIFFIETDQNRDDIIQYMSSVGYVHLGEHYHDDIFRRK